MKRLSVYDIDRAAIEKALDGIRSARVALIGDMCLDAYWHADMRISELSRETPHFPLPIYKETYSPGAGGNAAANMAALKPQSLCVLGAVGRDWRGDALIRALTERGIDASGVVISSEIGTNAYIKPMRHGISDVVYEDPRLDFVNKTPLSREDEEGIIETLKKRAQTLDCLCVSDQLGVGIITEAVRAEINRLASDGLTVIVDSRDRITLYKNCVLKPNEVELQRAMGKTAPDAEGLKNLAMELAKQNSARVLATMGGEGCAFTDGSDALSMTAMKVTGEIDICGAGDTFLSAFSCSLAGGASPETAMATATLASSVTIRKIGETGTATKEEILSAYDGGKI